jgi:2-polyprenyl-6-hydroxyphenyl methylase/3-demethylubiquinone-9 3-methyltransferase
VLDYGGGNDVFCAALRASGFRAAVTYDPMTPEHARRPDGKFELVTCFETLEHLPDPAAGIVAILEYPADTGLIFFRPTRSPSISITMACTGGMSVHATVTSRFSANNR